MCQGTSLQAAEKLVVLKGNGFSRDTSAAESTRPLSPEECFASCLQAMKSYSETTQPVENSTRVNRGALSLRSQKRDLGHPGAGGGLAWLRTRAQTIVFRLNAFPLENGCFEVFPVGFHQNYILAFKANLDGIADNQPLGIVLRL